MILFVFYHENLKYMYKIENIIKLCRLFFQYSAIYIFSSSIGSLLTIYKFFCCSAVIDIVSSRIKIILINIS